MIINIVADDSDDSLMTINISSTNDFTPLTFEKTTRISPEIHNGNAQIILKITLPTVCKNPFPEDTEKDIKPHHLFKSGTSKPVFFVENYSNRNLNNSSDIDDFIQSAALKV